MEDVPLSTQSLNSGDSFVLDLGTKLFVWSGKEAHRLEKAKALDVATALRDDRQGKPEVIQLATATFNSKQMLDGGLISLYVFVVDSC